MHNTFLSIFYSALQLQLYLVSHSYFCTFFFFLSYAWQWLIYFGRSYRSIQCLLYLLFLLYFCFHSIQYITFSLHQLAFPFFGFFFSFLQFDLLIFLISMVVASKQFSPSSLKTPSDFASRVFHPQSFHIFRHQSPSQSSLLIIFRFQKLAHLFLHYYLSFLYSQWLYHPHR